MRIWLSLLVRIAVLPALGLTLYSDLEVDAFFAVENAIMTIKETYKYENQSLLIQFAGLGACVHSASIKVDLR